MDKLKASFLMIMRGLNWRRTWTHNDTPVAPQRADAGSASIHPLLGALKGFVCVTPGTNLAKPVDPGWGK
jgi:hypothetical protein